MSDQPILTTHDIKKSFGDIEAVKDVNLMVYPGEAFGLLGPNGAGKTTIIGMILELLRPTAGSLTMFGETLNGSSKHLSRRIGAALETPALYPYLFLGGQPARVRQGPWCTHRSNRGSASPATYCTKLNRSAAGSLCSIEANFWRRGRLTNLYAETRHCASKSLTCKPPHKRCARR